MNPEDVPEDEGGDEEGEKDGEDGGDRPAKDDERGEEVPAARQPGIRVAVIVLDEETVTAYRSGSMTVTGRVNASLYRDRRAEADSIRLYLDGAELPAEAFTLELAGDGGLTIVISEEFMAKLESGAHMLRLVSRNNTLELGFTK